MIKKNIKKIVSTQPINAMASLVLPSKKKKLNKMLALAEAGKNKKNPKGQPTKITMSLSNCCNLLCPICSVHNLREKNIERVANNITPEQIKAFDKIFDKAGSINFMGFIGESVLNPHFKEIIGYLKLKHKLDLGMSTNGMGLNEKIQDTMLKIGFDAITFSIHAATPETYKILQAGDFETVIGNLVSLAKKKMDGNYKKPRITVVYALNKANIDEAVKMIDLIKKFKIDFFGLYHYHDYNHALKEIIVRDDEVDEINKKIDRLYNYAKEQGVIAALPKEPPYFQKEKDRKPGEDKDRKATACNAPWVGLQLRSCYSHQDSYYLGCCNVFNPFIFNYQKHIEKYGQVEFDKIWQHPVLQYLRQTVNARDGQMNPLCAYCKSSQRAHLKATDNKENYRIKLEMIKAFFDGFNKQYKDTPVIEGLEILYTEDEELQAMA
ncbi:radical SAM protein [Candidatus Kuenenbacteria bacterium]|nr:radical SAM protein [Candidatus Kuenenbacteria bacterium]